MLNNQLNGKRVFVSGGAGVIGLEMIPKLVERGANVMVGDLKSRPSEFPREVVYRQGDLNDMSYAEMSQFSPEFFIHLAATFERSEESYEFWQENFLHNINLSHHMMTLVKDLSSLKKVIFASSYLIYDPDLYQFATSQEIPVTLKETNPLKPRNLTGMAKFAHEIELRFIEEYRSSQFSSVSARIFRGYGKNSRDVISRWIRNLLNDEPINVYKPEGLFDYIYAADTAEGLIRLAESTKATGIINLGTGRSRRVSEVIEILRKYFPKLKLIDVESNIPFEASQADMSLFYELIGWLPEYKIENAIHEIINFESARKKNASIILKKYAPVVLVCSSSRKAPLITAIKAAANRIDKFSRVICGDIFPDVLTSFIGDDFWLMPETKDEMLDEILRGCKTRGINIILPTRDGELEFWSTHAKFFASHNIKIIISSIASIRRCVDKKLFSDFGKAQNLSFIPSSININFLDASRYVVKERYGAGSRSVGIGLDYKQALDHASKLNYPIFQPFVEGEEFSVDAWANNFHQVKGLVLRRRNLVINGESQITTTFSDTFIENEMKKIIEKLELRGPIVLQAIKDPQGIVHVIECNARFGGASNLGIEAGVDSLFWSIGEAVGLNIDEYPFIRKLTEVRQVRLPSDIYFYDSNF